MGSKYSIRRMTATGPKADLPPLPLTSQLEYVRSPGSQPEHRWTNSPVHVLWLGPAKARSIVLPCSLGNGGVDHEAHLYAPMRSFGVAWAACRCATVAIRDSIDLRLRRAKGPGHTQNPKDGWIRLLVIFTNLRNFLKPKHLIH